MIDSGIFTLKTPARLFEKLRRDLARVKSEPPNSDAWFNLVVTADHLPEWEFGADEEKAHTLREQTPILRIMHHLSRNAKHFKAREKRDRSSKEIILNPVNATNQVSVVSIDPRREMNSSSHVTAPPADAPTTEEYILTLSPKEAAELGTTEISALELAEWVVEFWRTRLKI